LTLEEIKEVFESKNPVRFANQLRKDRKDIIRERMKTMEKPIPGGH
jgi:SP family myo-inositol transporter-like MFS transporter 13